MRTRRRMQVGEDRLQCQECGELPAGTDAEEAARAHVLETEHTVVVSRTVRTRIAPAPDREDGAEAQVPGVPEGGGHG